MAQEQGPSGGSPNFCSGCGHALGANVRFCPQCGASAQATVTPPVVTPGSGAPFNTEPGVRHYAHVPNYLIQAILVTIFCCLPFGIVAIVYAAQVNGKLASGDYDGARTASQAAKKWAWISFGIGAGLGLLWLFFGACAAVIGA